LAEVESTQFLVGVEAVSWPWFRQHIMTANCWKNPLRVE